MCGLVGDGGFFFVFGLLLLKGCFLLIWFVGAKSESQGNQGALGTYIYKERYAYTQHSFRRSPEFPPEKPLL